MGPSQSMHAYADARHGFRSDSLAFNLAQEIGIRYTHARDILYSKNLVLSFFLRLSRRLLTKKLYKD